uniref:ATP synthase F0 subunit 8 n=1 Tax=Carcinocoris binghami TaxID=1347739 RepID=A0A342CF89_9HEMI|nr:ATP synthase F0 subunit 8 [Carcinocoris binghami]AGO28042.1 ATP synthase F0 subunit 8 [Carcinocoris binghami]
MPQMSPLWWSTLMIMFISALMLMMLTVYFLPLKEKGSMVEKSEYKTNYHKFMW